jgi:putative heme-binding domain-containing protein
MKRFRVFMFLPCLAAMFGPMWGQEHGSTPANPFSTPRDAEAGALIFRSQCAVCHGPEAAGGAVGPSLVSGTFRHGGSDEALYETITKGVPGTAMLPFKLSFRDVWQLIAFLRSMNVAKAAGEAPGDKSKGTGVFNTNGCARCHTTQVTATGGFTGPDLSEIGSHRSLQQIESSIIDPDAEVDPDYWSVRALTKAGQSVTGIRLNEDMDSFQIRDPDGRLRSLRKAELATFEIVRASPMPSYKSKLGPEELQDLVAYLASLRGPASPKVETK